MYIKLITDVATEPIDLPSAKEHLRVVSSDDDAYITSLITVAREFCESFTKRALASKTLELLLDSFPSDDYIDLPNKPIQSVTSVKYKDYEGTETDFTDYIANTDSGQVVLSYGYSWPSTTLYPTTPIAIRYVAGYTTDIPKSIKQAMLLLISHLYENREATSVIELKEVPFAVKSLLYPYKVWGF